MSQEIVPLQIMSSPSPLFLSHTLCPTVRFPQKLSSYPRVVSLSITSPGSSLGGQVQDPKLEPREGSSERQWRQFEQGTLQWTQQQRLLLVDRQSQQLGQSRCALAQQLWTCVCSFSRPGAVQAGRLVRAQCLAVRMVLDQQVCGHSAWHAVLPPSFCSLPSIVQLCFDGKMKISTVTVCVDVSIFEQMPTECLLLDQAQHWAFGMQLQPTLMLQETVIW